MQNRILQDALDDFEKRHLWGEITLVFRDGKIAVVQKNETVKILDKGITYNGKAY
jgi:hypothetical protein